MQLAFGLALPSECLLAVAGVDRRALCRVSLPTSDVSLPASVAGLLVASALPDLARALAEHRSAVLCAPPGSGKTTAVPLAFLDDIVDRYIAEAQAGN